MISLYDGIESASSSLLFSTFPSVFTSVNLACPRNRKKLFLAVERVQA